jgi:choline dehydrogenase-like flavoprotein
MDSARQLGYAWNKLPKIVYQDKCRPNCDKCVMGCPYGAKWSSRYYIDEARKNGAVMLAGASVRRVVHDKQAASAVEFRYRGQEFRVFARVIVLAAGGIGTPLLLRRSGLEGAGSDFFFDPLIIVFGTVEGLDGGKEFPMAAGHNFHEDGYILTDLVLPRWLYWLFTSQVLRLDRLPAHKRSLPIMVKARDELGGHLTKRGGVRKRLGASERQRLLGGYEKACQILRNAGARDIYTSWYLAVHPGGTAKIGECVDSNLKSAIDNLYVCDCSVLPEAWGLPPTLTLLALGKRLGKHLS